MMEGRVLGGKEGGRGRQGEPTQRGGSGGSGSGTHPPPAASQPRRPKVSRPTGAAELSRAARSLPRSLFPRLTASRVLLVGGAALFWAWAMQGSPPQGRDVTGVLVTVTG
ncbi:hypothetical protein E2C01_025958 [Portunus trituberculatus]|uniref:Uncharacterized protein n=1 Tax=Portunus trituberculatus TaxID=210409 RepID=A0A5B7EHK3_PORTR|nr:hypothetical protein [Portunus trituberculatus]